MTTPVGYGEGRYGENRYGGGGIFKGTYSRTTEEVYARLPDFYREADTEGVLKRWISAILDQVGEMRDLRERLAIDPARIDPTAPTGEALAIRASSMELSGPWVPVTSGGGGIGQQVNSAAWIGWEQRLEGGTYLLRMSYAAGPDRGIARVEIDGVQEVAFDTYSPTSELGLDVQIREIELDTGIHTVRVHWTGAKREDSTGTTITVLGLSLTNLRGNAADNSDLVNPSTADDAWLAWLGQFVGARLPADLLPAERRAAVRRAARLLAGSRTTMVEAAGTVLTGSRTVRIVPHSKIEGGLVAVGTPWDLVVLTNEAETPNPPEVIKAITRLGAKPAGVRLHHAFYTGTWTDFHAAYPTWTAIHAKRTWDELEDTGATTTSPVLTQQARTTIASASAVTAGGAVTAAGPATYVSLRGVNAAGADFGVRESWVRFDSDASFGYYAARGHKLIRLPFKWENVQPTLGGALDASHLTALKAAVTSCTSRGMRALLDVHNYGRYQPAGGGGLELAGVLQADSDAEWDDVINNAGAKTVEIHLAWDQMQPGGAGTALSTTAVQAMHDRFAAAAARGVDVEFRIGTQYPPPWVQDGVQPFRDQDGNDWLGNVGEKVRDWVWSATGRTYLLDYVTKVTQALTAAEKDRIVTWGIGPGFYGEMQYPRVGADPVRWWGFSPAAQGTATAGGTFTGTTVYDWEAASSTAGWAGLSGATTARTTTAHDGTGSMSVAKSLSTGTAVANRTEVSDTMISTAGRTLRTWLRLSSSYAGTNWQARIEMKNSSGTWVTGAYQTIATRGDWHEVEATFTEATWSGHTAVAFQVTADVTTAASATYYLDTFRQGTVSAGGTVDRASDQPACPTPGHKPFDGRPTGTLGNATDLAWVEWYKTALSIRLESMIDAIRAAGYTGQLSVLHPGYGVRDNWDSADFGWREQHAAGVDWDFQMGRYKTKTNVWPYCTWIDGEHYGGGLADPTVDSDKAAWLKLLELATTHGLTDHLYGENTGSSETNADMDRVFTQHALARGYKGIMWAFYSTLDSGDVGGDTKANLKARIAATGTGAAVLGDGNLTNAHLIDLWVRLADEFKGNPLVEFGLMNEPHDLPGSLGSFTGTTLFSFDASAQGWTGEVGVTVSHTTAAGTYHDGTGALRADKTGMTNALGQTIRLNDAAGNTATSAAGKTLRTWVRVPTGATGTWRAHLEVQNNAYTWIAGPDTNLTPGTWAELSYTPTDALWTEAPNAIAVQFTVDNPAAATASVYVDSIRQGTVTGSQTPAQQWQTAAQECVTAIRATGSSNYIRVAGYDWSSAKNYWTIHPSWWITDTASASGPEGHYYPDPTNNGVFADDGDTLTSVNAYAVSQGYANAAARAAAEVGQFVDGCTARGVKGLLGEFGWPKTDSGWNAVGEAIYDELDSGNVDATYWAAGEQWGTTYELSIYHGTPQSSTTGVAATVEAHPSQEAP